MPIYDLYIDDRPDEAGRDPTQVWRLEDFERGYQFVGYHEVGADFDRQLGYPPEVSDFLFRRVKNRMIKWVYPAEGHRVLDIGCGAGYFLYLIREQYRSRGFTPSIVGLDASTFQLFYMARRMLKENVHDVVVVRGNGEYLPFADHSFDLVTCSEVLEHIRNPIRALSEMNRVLKAHGLLLLSTPSMTAQRYWAILLAPLAILVKTLTRYSSRPDSSPSGYDIPWYPQALREVVRAAGFEIETFEHNAIIPHPWHFKFLPRSLVKPVVRAFALLDRQLKFLLKPLALHLVIRASKARTQSSPTPEGREECFS